MGIKASVVIMSIVVVSGCNKIERVTGPIWPLLRPTSNDKVEVETRVIVTPPGTKEGREITFFKNGRYEIKNTSNQAQDYIACSFRAPDQSFVDTAYHGRVPSGGTIEGQLRLDQYCTQLDIIQPPQNCSNYHNVLDARYYESKQPVHTLDYSKCVVPIPPACIIPNPPPDCPDNNPYCECL